MSKHRRYPSVGPWVKASTSRYVMMDTYPCDACHEPLGKNTEFMRRETQVSWFRGEDEVEAVHTGCFPGYAGSPQPTTIKGEGKS